MIPAVSLSRIEFEPDYLSSPQSSFLSSASGDCELEVLHGETPVHKYLPGDSFGE
jgi:hypothetical protein